MVFSNSQLVISNAQLFIYVSASGVMVLQVLNVATHCKMLSYVKPDKGC